MATPGTISWFKYGWETQYAAVQSTRDKVFGHGQKFTNLERKNNVLPIYACGSRNAQKLVAMQFEGMATVETVLANPWIFKAIMGGSSSTGAGPYTHTFAEANTLPSFSLENDVDLDTDSVSVLLGCLAASADFSFRVGEPVMVRMDIPFANETESTSTGAVVSESFDVFTFAQSTLEIPNGSALNDLQGASFKIDNSAKPLPGCGSRTAANSTALARKYTSKVNLPFEAFSVLLQNQLGDASGVAAIPAEVATMEFVFDNGLTSTNQRQIAALFTGVMLDVHNLPQDPNANIVEDVSLIMRSCSVTAINNTSAVP